MTNGILCWICGSSNDVATRGIYVHCRFCGHRFAAARVANGSVDNGVLAADAVASKDSLTAAQVHLAMKAALRHGTLLDVGSGTGKFLHHARAHFHDVSGIEVSSQSVRFAQQTLHLRIVQDISDTVGPFDIVTAWHSLEHIPREALHRLVAGLRERSHVDTRLVICVPNAENAAARWFGNRWAFRDTEAHLHEFSRKSLDALFATYGFHPVHVQRLWAYNLFAWVQTLCNMMPGPHNYLYYRLKRGRRYFANRKLEIAADGLATAVLCLVAPIGGACAAVEHLLLKQASVHLVTYAVRSAAAHGALR